MITQTDKNITQVVKEIELLKLEARKNSIELQIKSVELDLWESLKSVILGGGRGIMYIISIRDDILEWLNSTELIDFDMQAKFNFIRRAKHFVTIDLTLPFYQLESNPSIKLLTQTEATEILKSLDSVLSPTSIVNDFIGQVSVNGFPTNFRYKGDYK